MFARWPLLLTPSSMMSWRIVWSALSLPSSRLTFPKFYPDIPNAFPHLFSILLEKSVPSELLWSKKFFLTISRAWSSAAWHIPLWIFKALSGFCFSKKLYASYQADFPSKVLILTVKPSITTGKNFPLIKLSIYFLTYFANWEGFILA